MFRRLSEHGTPRSCYEATGAGYVLQRCLEHDGFHCEVIAPSLVPKKPGDRRKTDRLDAIHLAEQYRAGNLVAGRRADAGAGRDPPTGPLPPGGAVPRRAPEAPDRPGAGHPRPPVHRRQEQLDAEAPRLAEEAASRAGRPAGHRPGPPSRAPGVPRRRRSTPWKRRSIATRKSEPFRAKVEALCCFRGIKTLTAMTILTELGDIRRFARPTGLMAFAGLVPSERSSGNVQRRGSITKSGSQELQTDPGRGIVALPQAGRRRI